MSVRAYRVTKIEHDEPESFNVWRDEELTEYLANRYPDGCQTDMDGCGLISLPLKALEEAIEKVPMAPETKEALQKDIKAQQGLGQEQITYYCY